jgi:hypothetical protein
MSSRSRKSLNSPWVGTEHVSEEVPGLAEMSFSHVPAEPVVVLGHLQVVDAVED